MLNLDGKLWIMIAVLLIGLVLAIIAFSLPKKKMVPIDYYALFILGIIWLPLGIPLKNPGLTIMGLVFIIISIANKGKWKKNHHSYSQLSKTKQRFIILTSIILGVLILATLVISFLRRIGRI